MKRTEEFNINEIISMTELLSVAVSLDMPWPAKKKLRRNLRIFSAEKDDINKEIELIRPKELTELMQKTGERLSDTKQKAKDNKIQELSKQMEESEEWKKLIAQKVPIEVEVILDKDYGGDSFRVKDCGIGTRVKPSAEFKDIPASKDVKAKTVKEQYEEWKVGIILELEKALELISE